MPDRQHVLYLIICAAPPCRSIADLIDLLRDDGWDVHAIATPTAATWLARTEIERRTGHPVSYRQRQPDESSVLPRADAVLVTPATFNTINKWATGINDSLALGILNESLGARIPISVSVYAETVLTTHPAFAAHLRPLAGAGVRFTETEALRPAKPDGPFQWQTIVEALRTAASTSS